LCRASTSYDNAKSKGVDGIGTGACPSSARSNFTSRQQPTCDDKPGHDEKSTSVRVHHESFSITSAMAAAMAEKERSAARPLTNLSGKGRNRSGANKTGAPPPITAAYHGMVCQAKRRPMNSER